MPSSKTSLLQAAVVTVGALAGGCDDQMPAYEQEPDASILADTGPDAMPDAAPEPVICDQDTRAAISYALEDIPETFCDRPVTVDELRADGTPCLQFGCVTINAEGQQTLIPELSSSSRGTCPTEARLIDATLEGIDQIIGAEEARTICQETQGGVFFIAAGVTHTPDDGNQQCGNLICSDEQ